MLTSGSFHYIEVFITTQYAHTQHIVEQPTFVDPATLHVSKQQVIEV